MRLLHTRVARIFCALTGRKCLFAAARLLAGAAALAVAATNGMCADSSDPLLNALIKKGILTEQEAEQIKSETGTNAAPATSMSKWRISDAIKDVELFGDARVRYEDRSAEGPDGGKVRLQRYRYALRLGLRGDLFDNTYFGLRLETSANPRSPWVTFGSSTSGAPYQGPYGKSTAGVNLGQLYLGMRPEPWVDVTIGKMPNPIYTTPMVWDGDLNPEGLAERFKYTVGPADFFATLGQFIYEDTNPTEASQGFFPSFSNGSISSGLPFLLAWQLGLTYHVDKDISIKTAPVLYNYTGHGVDTSGQSSLTITPGFSDTFVGQGVARGATYGGIPVAYGFSGYPLGNPNPSEAGVTSYDGFAANQTGINDLLILEFPAEINFKIGKLNARIFGDFAENLDGAARAQHAYEASKTIGGIDPINSPATDQTKAWQAGFAIGNGENLGLVYGQYAKKNTWEARAYWQHVEQYALDPNLLDSDFFEGRGNLQGFFSAIGYCLTDNLIGTVRFGYATRIDRDLGTGGSNQDLPQVNPMREYQVLQFDLTARF